MAGIEWKDANIDIREPLSLTKAQVGRISEKISRRPEISGCVIIATCNRTEIYITGFDGMAVNPGELLAEEISVTYSEYRRYFTSRSGNHAVHHLMEVACGLRSLVLGEDQILAQVKDAIGISQENGASDSVLNTLFRNAVTAGKKVRSSVRLTSLPLSVAGMAIEEVKRLIGKLEGTRAVVIGNGEMGRLSASLLVRGGCDVTITLRSYHHGKTIVPAGCNTIPYDHRMQVIDGSDILLSATASPHYTVTRELMAGVRKCPGIIVDLAMPRDIEPLIITCPGVKLLDMDNMGGGYADGHNAEALSAIGDIIDKYVSCFYQWQSYGSCPAYLRGIKN